MKLPQPTASRHLKLLRERSLVIAERDGTSVYYTLADPRVIDALDILRRYAIKIPQAARDLLESGAGETPKPDDARFAQWHYRKDPTHVVFYRAATFRWLAARHGWSCAFPVKDVVLMRNDAAAGVGARPRGSKR